MNNEYTVSDITKREVTRIVEQIVEDVTGDDAIVQDLRDYTRVRARPTDDEIKIMDGGKDVRIRMLMASESIKSRAKSRLGLEGSSGSRDRGTSGEVVDTMSGPATSDAGMGEVHKPFSHQEANYKEPGDVGFDSSHERCKDCAHYDNHGNCRIVPDIQDDAYCEEFFADVTISGHAHEGYVEENLTIWGEMFDFSMADIEDFTDDVKEILEGRIR